MADGSLIFDTKIDSSGFDTGLKSLKESMKSLESEISNLSKTLIKTFSSLDTSKAQNSINEVALTADSVSDNFKNAGSAVGDLAEQMHEIPIEHWNQSSEAIDEVTESVVNVEQELQKVKPVAQEVNAAIDSVGNTGDASMEKSEESTSAFNNMINLLKQSISDIPLILNIVGEKFNDAFNGAGNVDTANAKIKSLVDEVDMLQDALYQLERQGLYFGDGNYDETYRKLALAKQELDSYKRSLTKTDSTQKKATKSSNKHAKSLDKISKSSNKAKKATSGLSKTLGMLKMSLIMSVAFRAFQGITEGIGEGIQNLAKYSDDFNGTMSELKSSMTRFKNSIATAFAPIMQVAIPYLVKLIDKLSEAMTMFAQFVAALMGKKTIIKATEVQEDYTESLDDTKESADKAKNSLYAFDELNTIDSDDSRKKEDDKKTDVDNMFEEIPIDTKILDFINNLKEALQPVIEYAKELAGIFMNGFWDGLGDYEYRFSEIKKGLQQIKGALADIWTDPQVLSSADAFIESLSYMIGSFVGSLASIGLTIGTFIIGGLGDYLSSNKDRIKQYLISMFDIGTDINILLSQFFQDFAYIFEAFASENGIRLSSAIIGIFSDGFMGATELAAKFGRDILSCLLQPIIDNKEGLRVALEDFLGVLADVATTIKDAIDDTFDKMNEVYDKHLKPFFDSVEKGLSELLAKMLEVFNEYILPVLQQLAEKFDTVFKEHIQPTLDKFIELIGKVFDLLKVLWEKLLVPFLNFLIEKFGKQFGDALDSLGNAFLDFIAVASDIVGDIITILGGVIDFLTGVFSGDWEKAWDGICQILEGAWEGIKTIIKTIINIILEMVESFVNGVISGINLSVKALNSLSSAIPDWVPIIGGGLNISTIPSVNIPRLATGTVVPPTSGEFAAILGDNNRETEIVSPLSTMKQALKEALAESNGNNNNGNTTINLQVDGATFAQIILPYLNKEENRHGVNLVEGVFAT